MNRRFSEYTTIAEIVTQYPQTRRLLEELGLDYCCGGKTSLQDASQKAGLSCQEVLTKLNEKIDQSDSKESPPKNWMAVPMTELIRHIVDIHHTYLKENLPRLKNLSEKVYRAHMQHHGDMLQKLKQVLETLRIDLEMHLAKEEEILFPLIREMESFANNQGPRPAVHCGTIQNPIQQMEYEHQSAGELLGQMRKITSDYQLPADACRSFQAFYEGLQDLEQDLHEHIHLENNILFPRALQLERQKVS